MTFPSPDRRHFCLQLGAGLAGLSAGATWASSFPERSIKIIVPFAPGAGTDAMGRLVAGKLAELLKVSVVVDNRTGASGALGAQEVARAAPDGHTLLLAAAPFTTVPAALPTAGYDPIASFTPVGMIAHGPLVWAANKDLPANTLPELVALARSQPGRLNYGSAGVGGINHLVLESLKARTGTFITHIPYRGAGPALNDTVGGQVPIIFDNLPSALPFIQAGKLIPIAVAAPKRLEQLPNVPTFKEVGLEPVNRMAFFGIIGPKGLPKEVVDKVNAGVRKSLEDPAVRKRIEGTGSLIVANTPEQFAEQIKAEFEIYKQLVNSRKLKLD